MFHPNGKIKPNIVLVRGKEEKHAEGSYFLNYSGERVITPNISTRDNAGNVKTETVYGGKISP